MKRPDESSRLDALSRLMTSIAAEIDAGQYVPCVDPRRGHLWLSEGRDEREAAALGCSTCPALSACTTYVERFPEPSGVWAGRVPRINTRHHRKETNA